jgi:hypothetical protein
VTVPDIKAISVFGDSEVISNGNLLLDELDINIIGLAKITLSGEVNKQTIDIEGDATAHNFNFVSDSSDIKIYGAGNLEVNSNSNLDILVRGEAKIKYKGQPIITEDIIGKYTLTDAN